LKRDRNIFPLYFGQVSGATYAGENRTLKEFSVS